MTVSDSNRRRYLRIQPEPSAPVEVDINGEGFIDILKAADISEGGVGIIVPHQFEGCEIDKSVSLSISLPFPDRQSFTVRGYIKHTYGSRFGVKFVDVKKPYQNKIRAYILHRLKQQSLLEYFKYWLGFKA